MPSLYWVTQTTVDVPTDNDWLTTGEQACLETLRLPKRRADWRLGRWTAKCALAAISDSVGSQRQFITVEVRAAEDGAPEPFVDGKPAPCLISISHCRHHAVCAVGLQCHALGCDLESIEPRSKGFVADFFTREEQQRIDREPFQERDELVTLTWSAKESALKALREGLRLDTRSVVVSLGSRSEIGPWNQLSVTARERDLTFNGWWRRDGSRIMTVVANPSPSQPVQLTCPAHPGVFNHTPAK